jgi:hypothetical protein
MYHSPVPALLIHLPANVLFRTDVLDAWVVLVFMLGAYVFVSLSILHIQRRHFPDTPKLAVLCAYLAAGFGNCVFILLSRTAMYEVCISFGVFFFSGALYLLLVSYSLTGSRNDLCLLFCGLFLGLSVWSRPTYGLGAVFLLVVSAIYLLVSGLGLKGTLRRLFFLSLAFCFVMFLMMSYNFLRFDSPFEFGTKYQLTCYNPKILFKPSLSHIPIWVYVHFFTPPQYAYEFPYIHLNTDISGSIRNDPRSIYFVEPISSLHMISPYLLVLVFLPLKVLWSVILAVRSCVRERSFLAATFFKMDAARLHLAYVMALLLSSLFGVFFFFSIIPVVCQRYVLDYAPLMLLLSAICWFQAIDSLKGKRGLYRFRHLLYAVMILLTLITIASNILLFFSGSPYQRVLVLEDALQVIFSLP